VAAVVVVALLATVMATLLDRGEIRTMPTLGNIADVVTGSAAIPGLVAG
jgi:hypothetical protein